MNGDANTPGVGPEGLGDPKIETAWQNLLQVSRDALADIVSVMERWEDATAREWGSATHAWDSAMLALRTHQAVLRLRDQYRQHARRENVTAHQNEPTPARDGKDGQPHG